MYNDETDPRHENKKNKKNITVNELLSAISETEYPQSILESISTIQEWMKDMTEQHQEPKDPDDIFASLFGSNFDEDMMGLNGLFERLKSIEDAADIIPNSKMPDGKSDTVIISITPQDYESGIRTAIDYAAVFNKTKSKRVWIISDTFIFDEVFKFVPHVDALSEQGIMLRYILVTPWGWVEMPLSGSSVSKHKFLWHTKSEKQDIKQEETKPKTRTRRRKQE